MSGDTEQVIGRVDEYGMRHEGLIDKYANEINVADAIAKVAANIELSAEPVKAVHLYHAAEVLITLCMLRVCGVQKVTCSKIV